MESVDRQELLSLLILLEDTDPFVVEAVDCRVLEIGRAALDFLLKSREGAACRSKDDAVMDRIIDLYRKYILTELKAELSTGYPDLTNSLYLLTALADPWLTRDAFDAGYIPIVEELLKELNTDGTAIENVEIMNYVFFHRFKFRCVNRHSVGGNSVLMNRLLENRKGFPVAVAIAYFLVARNAGLPIFPIPTPSTGFSAVYIYNGTTILAIDVGDKGKIFPVPAFIEALRNMYPGSRLSDEQLLVPGDDKMVLGIYIESLASYFEYQNKEALVKIYDKASKIVGQKKILG